MSSRRSYFSTLADAKESAFRYAEEDDADWNVYSYGGETFEIRLALEARPPGGRLMACAKPGLLTIRLTPEEAAHYKEYIETERMTTNGFVGGMYETPVEKSILAKLKGALKEALVG